MKVPTFKIFKYSKSASIIAAVVVVVLAVGGTSAYAAHSDALPGSTMYPFKRLWEGTQMLLSFSPADKAQTNVSIAQDRVKAAQAVVSQTPASSSALNALQQAQEHLQTALTQTGQITDPTKKKEAEKSISDAAKEAEQEAETEKEVETSNTDKQDLQHTSDQIKQIQSQASSDD